MMKLKNNELKISQPPCVDSCLATIKRSNTRLRPNSVGKNKKDFFSHQITISILAIFTQDRGNC